MQRMQIFDLLPHGTKTLQIKKQITGVEKPNKEPKNLVTQM